MILQLLALLAFHITFVGLLFGCQWIYKHLNWPAEITRKIAHVIAGLTSLSFPYFFSSHWYVLTLGISFTVILFLGKKRNWFPGIEAVNRSSIGSALLPVSIYLCFFLAELLDSTIVFYLPILVLSLSDPLAAVVGRYLTKKTIPIQFKGWNSHKTVQGSLAFFASSFIISASLLAYSISEAQVLANALLFALVATLAELTASKGLDNLSIPLSLIVLIYLVLI